LHALSTTTREMSTGLPLYRSVRLHYHIKVIVPNNNLKSQSRKWLSALHVCLGLRTHTYFMTGIEVKEQLWRGNHERHHTQPMQLLMFTDPYIVIKIS